MALVFYAVLVPVTISVLLVRHSGQAITLTIGYCLATFPLLLERTETEDFGLNRIPEQDLAFPEEYMRPKLDIILDDENFDLILDVVDENDGDESNFPTENTKLLP